MYMIKKNWSPENTLCCCCSCYVAVYRPQKTTIVTSVPPVNLTTLFHGRVRPTKRLSSAQCTVFRRRLDNCPKKIFHYHSQLKKGAKPKYWSGDLLMTNRTLIRLSCWARRYNKQHNCVWNYPNLHYGSGQHMIHIFDVIMIIIIISVLVRIT